MKKDYKIEDAYMKVITESLAEPEFEGMDTTAASAPAAAQPAAPATSAKPHFKCSVVYTDVKIRDKERFTKRSEEEQLENASWHTTVQFPERTFDSAEELFKWVDEVYHNSDSSDAKDFARRNAGADAIDKPRKSEATLFADVSEKGVESKVKLCEEGDVVFNSKSVKRASDALNGMLKELVSLPERKSEDETPFVEWHCPLNVTTLHHKGHHYQYARELNHPGWTQTIVQKYRYFRVLIDAER